PLFAAFSLAELIELADHIDERALRRNRTLFHEGETSAEMFVVRQGIVLISKEVTPRVEKVLARMKPGEFFGEMNLFGCPPLSASALPSPLPGLSFFSPFLLLPSGGVSGRSTSSR